MKNIFSFFTSDILKINLLNISKRFPISIALIFVSSFIFFTISHGEFTDITKSNLFRVNISIIITFFLSLGVYLSCEKLGFNELKRNIFQIFVLLFGILFFLGFKGDFVNFDNMLFFILTLFGIITYLFFAPYLKDLFVNKYNQNVYYTYFYKISVVFLISFIFGRFLFILGLIGIGVTFSLFDLNFIDKNKIFQDWAIISLSFLAPIFALIQIPKKETFNENSFYQNAFFSFLVKYISIPFIYIYFIILYIYSVKVLLNFGNWPKGEVSWMVIGFSSFGYLIYIFSYIFEEKNNFIKIFRKVFPFVVIPQLFMLFYAICLRISQYDITMNRYFVVIFGIWLGFISFYLIFSRKKNLAFIPFILTVFTIIISIGPWSVYNLPESRQLIILENNLKKAGILKNGEISPLENYEDIQENLSKDIYSGIEYLCDYNDCIKIKNLFPKQYSKVEKDYEIEYKKNFKGDYQFHKISNWEIVSGITNEIKVKKYFTNIDFLDFHLDIQDVIFPIDVKGYSTIFEINSDKYYINEGILEITREGKIIDSINIKSITEKLYDIYKTTKKTKLKKEELTFDLKGKNGNYRIIINSIRIKNPLYKGEYKSNYNISGYILIK